MADDWKLSAGRALRVAGSTPDEREVGDLLDELAQLHLPGATRSTCRGCAEPWPCRGDIHALFLAVQWVGRAADRVSGLHPLPRPDPATARAMAARAQAEHDAAEARKPSPI